MQAKKTATNNKQGTTATKLRLAETKRPRSGPKPETNKEQPSAGKVVWQIEQRSTSDKLAYSVKEAAEAIGVSAWYIRDEMAQGRLAYSCPRGRQMIPRWELIRYLQEYMSPAALQEADGQTATGAAGLSRGDGRRQVMA